MLVVNNTIFGKNQNSNFQYRHDSVRILILPKLKPYIMITQTSMNGHLGDYFMLLAALLTPYNTPAICTVFTHSYSYRFINESV